MTFLKKDISLSSIKGKCKKISINKVRKDMCKKLNDWGIEEELFDKVANNICYQERKDNVIYKYGECHFRLACNVLRRKINTSFNENATEEKGDYLEFIRLKQTMRSDISGFGIVFGYVSVFMAALAVMVSMISILVDLTNFKEQINNQSLIDVIKAIVLCIPLVGIIIAILYIPIIHHFMIVQPNQFYAGVIDKVYREMLLEGQKGQVICREVEMIRQSINSQKKECKKYRKVMLNRIGSLENVMGNIKKVIPDYNRNEA